MQCPLGGKTEVEVVVVVVVAAGAPLETEEIIKIGQIKTNQTMTNLQEQARHAGLPQDTPMGPQLQPVLTIIRTDDLLFIVPTLSHVVGPPSLQTLVQNLFKNEK